MLEKANTDDIFCSTGKKDRAIAAKKISNMTTVEGSFEDFHLEVISAVATTVFRCSETAVEPKLHSSGNFDTPCKIIFIRSPMFFCA